MAQWIAKALTIGCTATDFPPLRGSKPAREPGVIEAGSVTKKIGVKCGKSGVHFRQPVASYVRRSKSAALFLVPSLRFQIPAIPGQYLGLPVREILVEEGAVLFPLFIRQRPSATLRAKCP
jgi:hypothetical protein